MSTKEELIKELIEWKEFDDCQLGMLADFIIEDRKRIVEPLVNHNKSLEFKFGGPRDRIMRTNIYEYIIKDNGYDAIKAIDQTLKNAGVEI